VKKTCETFRVTRRCSNAVKLRWTTERRELQGEKAYVYRRRQTEEEKEKKRRRDPTTANRYSQNHQDHGDIADVALLLQSPRLCQHPMPDTNQHRRNLALQWGAILTFLGLLGNVVSFLVLVNRAFLWFTLLIGAAGVVLLLVGLSRAFARPQVFRGKIAGSILTAVSVLLFAVSAFGFFHARDVPVSAGAPKVGQKAPDFTLTDTGGQAVSLAQLLSSPIGTASGRAPKAVLLVFYRGYW
jgi:hypothetical protein